ncbi:unnamed protein product [Taenia asiatica]|uniref:Uncharacterized protein n=1 Tax=Taenia asiatica TaxID=60517 RepID=A0A0R3VZE3_TAEAS|nr:unnamed protein product [Taenia asiatica]
MLHQLDLRRGGEEQAFPSPPTSDGTGDSMPMSWLRSAPHQSTNRIAEKSSPPATHLLSLARRQLESR